MIRSLWMFIRSLGPQTIGFGLAALILAGGSGFAASFAFGARFGTPTTTVTISVATGPQGPPGATGPPGPIGPIGPQGPTGPSGAQECPAGSVFGKVVFNAPGGQTALYACIVG